MKEFIIELSKKAGKIALEELETRKVSYKSEKNLVTNADIKIENFIKSKILEKYPLHSIISEESPEIRSDSEFTWIIDPIDGTANYAHNNPHFCISLALSKNQRVILACVFAPLTDEFYFAELGKGSFLNNKRISVSKNNILEKSMIYYMAGITREILDYRLEILKLLTNNTERVRGIGSLALETCYVAADRGDGVLRFKEGSKLWDYAAAALILEEAGGKATDFNKNRLTLKKTSDFIGSNSLIHDQLIDLLNKNIKGDLHE
ncbi:inositol monophosphatase [Candidatus Woesearchaeota archaeon]|nr:inositol monophosphatase [Candidatus Woesearchaeota archaeon]